jgi:hypothetical protein
MSETQGGWKRLLSWGVIWKVGLLALIVCAVGFAIHRRRCCPIAFVDAKEIGFMHAGLYKRSGEAVVFTVDSQTTIAQILDAMRPVSRDWHPADWQKYGFLIIEFTNGTKATAAIYDVGEEVAAFSIDGAYYRGGSETKLKAVLQSEGKRRGRKWESKPVRESRKKVGKGDGSEKGTAVILTELAAGNE